MFFFNIHQTLKNRRKKFRVLHTLRAVTYHNTCFSLIPLISILTVHNEALV